MITSGTNRTETFKGALAMVSSGTNRAETLKGARADGKLRD